MKMKNLSLKAVAPVGALALTMALMSCAQPSNPERMAPAASTQMASDSKPIETTAVFQPKVDILFVIDNSDSMKDHIAKLATNIDRFVAAFKKNERVDFQIGVVSVFDSVRYGPKVKDFHPLGVFYPVKRASAGGMTFVTRNEPEYEKTLSETLKIGTIARGTDENDLGGPEFEETFTPALAALDGRNVGFLRPEAHLAVIMITDADDVSSVAVSKMKAELKRIKGGDASMVSTFAVLARTCAKVDPGIKGTGPAKILQFIKETGGSAYDLCEDDRKGRKKGDPTYGDRLAEAGNLIAKKATKTLRVPLEAPPASDAKGVTTLRVVFHEGAGPIDEVERSRICATGENQLKKTVWYDAEKQQVVVPGSAMQGRPVSTTIQICYEKAKVGSQWVKLESETHGQPKSK